MDHDTDVVNPLFS